MLAAPLLAACAPTPASAPGCAAAFDEAAVVAVLEQQREAWNRADLEGFLAGYEPSEQLLFTSGGNIRRGFTQTRDKYRARYGTAAETMGTLAFEILDVRPLGSCKDAAIVLGRWQLTDTPSAGQGVFSVMLERHGERWEIVHDHTSAATE
jgi:uncharacterized protein (TIGR02246 family)